jgi:hypothetical protein
MGFPSAVWRILKPGPPSFLFVDAESGRIVPVAPDGARRYLGFGLWFHDFGEYEIVTTHIKRSGSNLWLHEYYRIDGDFMQWSNFSADIMHERASEGEVPPECLRESKRILDLSANRDRPDYDPGSVRNETQTNSANKPWDASGDNVSL